MSGLVVAAVEVLVLPMDVDGAPLAEQPVKNRTSTKEASQDGARTYTVIRSFGDERSGIAPLGAGLPNILAAQPGPAEEQYG